jgi:hypothetical protein
MANEKLLHDLVWGRAMEEVYWCKPAPTVLPKDRTDYFSFVADYVGTDRVVDYLEFGVAQGNSMRLMAKLFTHPDSRFYGFDSFEGLPEKWQMHEVGAFSNEGRPPEIADQRVSFIKGWFQNSVPEFLPHLRKIKQDPQRLTLVHFDVDLYSASLFLLSMCWAELGEYFFMFDDFVFDEVIALRDFCTAFPVDIRFLAQTKGGGHQRPNPDQVFGHMRRIRFELPARDAA